MKKKLLKLAVLTLAIVMLAGVMAPAASAVWQATPGSPGSGAESIDGGQNWYWLTAGGRRAVGWHNIGGAWYNFRLNAVMQRAGDPSAQDAYWAALPAGEYSRFLMSVNGVETPVANRNVLGFFREPLPGGAGQIADSWPAIQIGQDAVRIAWSEGLGSYIQLDTAGGEWAGVGDIYRVNGSGVMSTGWTALVVNNPFHVGMVQNAQGLWVGRGPVHNVGGHWYYFGQDGRMRANEWVQTDGSWFRLGGNGQMIRNDWVEDTSRVGATTIAQRFRVGGSGAMVTGWSLIGGHWYFFEANGTMQFNRWVETNGQWFWVVAADIYNNLTGEQIFPRGSMARNGVFNVGSEAAPNWHAFDHAGVWLGQVAQPAHISSPWWSANPPHAPAP